MALTAEDIRSLTGLAPELREVLVELLAMAGGGGEIGAGSVTHDKLAANAVEENNIKDGAVTAGKIAPGVIPEKYKQAAAVTDPESDESAAVSTSLKALTASLRAAGILQA